MVPFFIQFKCKLGQSYAVANALAEAEIASEIYSTAGDYDLLVKFYVDNDTDIAATSSTRRYRSFPASRTPIPSSPSRRSAPARQWRAGQASMAIQDFPGSPFSKASQRISRTGPDTACAVTPH